MNIPLLIDAVVRQTTILIAQLSTAGGLRAPLSHVANQVFLDLVTELEGQGLGRKVIADMFGLALRSYQQKVQRLSESTTERGQSLWEVVLGYVQQQGVVSRGEVLTRFARDGEADVRSILADLVGSGFVYKTGRGEATLHRAAAQEEVGRALAAQDRVADAAFVWVAVYRSGPLEQKQLLERLRIEPEALDRALERLLAEGRIQRELHDGRTVYRAESCFIAGTESEGWEAALFDHYQAVVGAMCAKLAALRPPGTGPSRIGGSTFSFDVWPGHPHAERALSLLERTRAQLSQLWDELHAYNQHAQRPIEYQRITFYFGQNVTTESAAQADAETTA